MEKYEFQDEEGFKGTVEEVLELCKLAKKAGYALSEPAGSCYWNNGYFIWTTSLGYFNRAISSKGLCLQRTFEEMKSLLTTGKLPIKKEKLQASIFGGDEFIEFMKKHQNLTFPNGTPPFGNAKCYYNFDGKRFLNECDTSPRYQVFTVREFELLLTNKTTKTMDLKKKIIVPADFQRKGFSAMTKGQVDQFKDKINLITGETTLENLIYCYNHICDAWKEKLIDEFPELKEALLSLTKDVDVAKHINDATAYAPSTNRTNTNYLICMRGSRDYEGKGFYLNDNYNWEIVRDSNGVIVLLPTKK